jgi:hypothetical protein
VGDPDEPALEHCRAARRIRPTGGPNSGSSHSSGVSRRAPARSSSRARVVLPTRASRP